MAMAAKAGESWRKLRSVIISVSGMRQYLWLVKASAAMRKSL
jgi:hypothetical protein